MDEDNILIKFEYGTNGFKLALDPCKSYHRDGDWFVQDFADGRQVWNRTDAHDCVLAVTKIHITEV
jgi:hypothetical protein